MPFVIARMISLFLAVIVAPLSLLLLFVGQSHESKLFGTAWLLIGLVPLIACLLKEGGSKRGLLIVWPGLAIAGAMLIWLAVQSPDGSLPETAKIQHRFTDGQPGFPRYSLGNLFPELDQFLLGFKVIPLADRLFTFDQSRRLSVWTAEIYRELEADSDFHRLGSAMPLAYNDLLSGQHRQGHYYLYIPASLNRRSPSPVLVFLHGSGGNFKAYTWLLSRIADELGMVLICPSYGMGDWAAEDTAKVIHEALEDAGKVVSLNRQKMHLMGLSNGGRGVGHAGRAMGTEFQSFTLISPVIEMPSIRSPEFIKNTEGKPVFIMTGSIDDRVPIASVKYAASVLTRQASVTLKEICDADHFLLFSHREEVIRQLKDWLASNKNLEAITTTPDSPAPGNRPNWPVVPHAGHRPALLPGA